MTLRILAIATGAVIAGCGGSVSPATNDGGAADTIGVIHPPANPGGPPSGGTGRTALAIKKLYFGDSDRNGNASPDAWRQYGYDIDGRVTTETSTDVCRLGRGAFPSTQVDGAGGIDNSFGENLLPFWLTLFGANLPDATNEAIKGGGATPIIVVDGLGAGADSFPLSARIVGGAPFVQDAATPSAPAWDGSDRWPLDRSTLDGADPSTAKLAFGASYVSGGVFVAAPPSSLGGFVVGPITGAKPFLLSFPLTHVTVSMQMSPDGASATQGILSAIIPAEDYVAYVHAILGCVLPDLRDPETLSAIDAEIRATADILIDGSQDPTRPCDGISVGLGFEAQAVELGPVVATTSSCGDP
jgi:hypothetical protein